MNEHIPDKLALTAYVSGDLPLRELKQLKKHIEQCALCQKFIDQLKNEKREFLKKFPIESIPKKHFTQSVPFPTLAHKHIYSLAASLVIIVTGVLFFYRSQIETDDMRVKGGVSMKLVVLGTEGAVQERANRIYYPHEKIQFIYSSSRQKYYLLFSIDEKGNLSTYLPTNSDSSLSLEKGADLPLPPTRSIRLDNYIGNELFIALFSQQKLSTSWMKEIIINQFNRASTLDEFFLPETKEYSIQTFFITKAKMLR